MQTGGNTAMFVTADGVVLVDTKLAGYGQDILDLVASVTDKPVTTIINTHTHFDHTGSNNEFPDTVEFIVHENTRAQMARATCQPVTNCEAFKGENAKYLPATTFSSRRALFGGQDRIDLYYFGRGHTDGDTFVVFRAARTVHTGDMFQRKGLPFIDVANGNGSATEFGSTLHRAVDGIQERRHGHHGASHRDGAVERLRELQRVLQRSDRESARGARVRTDGRAGGRRLHEARSLRRLSGAGRDGRHDRAARLQ